MTELTYLRAISDGLRTEMREDERVLLMGEDIGVYGGAFKVTDGFIEEFGADRVMDTPLAESGIVGTAVGAAVVGLRPVCEMQFADFVSCGFDQIVNVAGKMLYRQGLPVIFVLENNQFAYSTPIKQQFAVNPVERAAAYGFPGVSVDGNDVEAMFEATRAARERAISGGGPTLIEAVTMRKHGHGAHDDMKYVPKALVEEWRQRDPIDRQSARCKELGVDVEALRKEVRAAIDAAAKTALAGPMPDPATVTDRLFHPRDADEILLEDGEAPWSGFKGGAR
jgi:hypothetical protein